MDGVAGMLAAVRCEARMLVCCMMMYRVWFGKDEDQKKYDDRRASGQVDPDSLTNDAGSRRCGWQQDDEFLNPV